MEKTTSIYVLKLEHGKYFVGESDDPVKQLEEHREGLGPLWTQLHKPIQILEIIPFQRGQLDVYTKRTMRSYGIENVRGGTWSMARLTDAQRHALHDSSCLLA